MGVSLRPLDDIIAILLAFIVATTIHEYMHARVAYELGDETAASQGRITFNPVSHFEPFGFFGMVMIAVGFPFIGWGKPVPVSPWRMTRLPRERRKQGLALVALAAPVSNIVLAILAVIPLQLAIRNNIELGQLLNALNWFVLINILLASFNMIPIPPLDGFNVLNGLLPDFWTPILSPLAKYGFPILLVLIFVGGSLGDTIFGSMAYPLRNTLQDLLYRGLV